MNFMMVSSGLKWSLTITDLQFYKDDPNNRSSPKPWQPKSISLAQGLGLIVKLKCRFIDIVVFSFSCTKRVVINKFYIIIYVY